MDSSNASSSSASICNAGIVALRASQPTLANEGDPAANVAAVARVQVDLTQEATEDANVPPTKKAKKCSSEVWSHFDKYEKKVVGDDGTEIVELWAKCKKCSYTSRRESNRGTTIFWSHLDKKHQIKSGQQLLNLKKSESGTSVETYRYDEAVSLKKFYLAIIMHEYPFNIVEHEYFVDFIKSLRPTFPIKSRITIRKDTLNMFLEEKKKMYEYFKTLSCRFCTTMDMWTSNQNKCYMCITVHWIDDNWCMQKRIIKFMHVEGHHSGNNLCKVFYDSVLDWNLDRKLLALTLDNASANDVCARGLVQKLNKIQPLICDGAFFHVRCLNHIFNLVAQDGLKQISSSISNIRNTVWIVKNSPLQWEEFMKCASECDGLDITCGLSLDVPTRWNSTFLMLKQAIHYRLAFNRLFLRHRHKYLKCAPTDDDWTMAKSLCTCLKRFYDATLIFSGSSYPTAIYFLQNFVK